MALLEGEPRLNGYDISRRFGIAQSGPRPSEDQLLQQRGIAADIEAVAQRINSKVADGYAKEQAQTHLEAALMWVGKAIFAP